MFDEPPPPKINSLPSHLASGEMYYYIATT